VNEAAKGVGAQVEKNFPHIDVQLLSFPEVKSERAQEAREQALQRKKEVLQRNPNVEAAEYNHVQEPAWIPRRPEV